MEVLRVDLELIEHELQGEFQDGHLGMEQTEDDLVDDGVPAINVVESET